MQNDVISELSIKATLDAKPALGSLNALKGELLELEKTLEKLNSMSFVKEIASKANNATKATQNIAKSVKIPDTTVKSIEAVSARLDHFQNVSASVRNAYVSQANAQNKLVQATENYSTALNKLKSAETTSVQSTMKRKEFELLHTKKGRSFDVGALNEVDKSRYVRLLYDEEKAQTAVENAKIGVENATISYTTAQNNANNASVKYTETLKKQSTQENKNKDTNKKFSDQLAKFSAKATIIAHTFSRIGQAIGKLVDISNEYVENLNLFTVAMGDAVDNASEFVDKFSSALHLDPSEVMRYTGFFQQIATGFGIATQEAYEFSEFLTQFSYDLSSFLNIDIDDAVKKVQSGFAGELEPLRRVGFALDEATLQQVAYSLGVNKTIRSMTQAEKSYLRVYALAQQGTNIFGDLAETIESPANQLRILRQQITLAARALGNAFSPFIREVLPPVIALLKVATERITDFANRLGFTVEGARTSATAIEGLATATNELSEAQNGLLSFDKFESLSPSNGEGAGNIFAGMSIPQYDALLNISSKFEEKIKEAGLTTETFGKFLDVLFEIIIVLVPVFEKLLDILDNLLPKLNPIITAIQQVTIETNGWAILVPIILYAIISLMLKFGLLVQKIQSATTALKSFLKTTFTTSTSVTRLGSSLMGTQAKFASFTGATTSGFSSITHSVGILVAGLSLLIMGFVELTNWKHISWAQRFSAVLKVVAGAAFILAYAMATVNSVISWGAFAVGFAAIVGSIAASMAVAKSNATSIGTFAEGGFPARGQMFIANEAGAELVGNIGGRTAVANNDMIVQAIENAAYRGYKRAIGETSNGANSVTVGFDVDNNAMARALYPYVKNEKSRRGDKW